MSSPSGSMVVASMQGNSAASLEAVTKDAESFEFSLTVASVVSSTVAPEISDGVSGESVELPSDLQSVAALAFMAAMLRTGVAAPVSVEDVNATAGVALATGRPEGLQRSPARGVETAPLLGGQRPGKPDGNTNAVPQSPSRSAQIELQGGLPAVPDQIVDGLLTGASEVVSRALNPAVTSKPAHLSHRLQSDVALPLGPIRDSIVAIAALVPGTDARDAVAPEVLTTTSNRASGIEIPPAQNPASQGISASDDAGINSTEGASAEEHSIRTPVGAPRWADELATKMVLLAVRNNHEGSLILSPEHLGPVEVRISVDRDTANVWFGAQNAETRAALADAMPKLREMFAASGMSLGQSGVSHQSPRGGSAPGQIDRRAEQVEAPGVIMGQRLRSGALDVYA